MNKILTSPSSFGQVGEEPFKFLSDNGYEVINNPYGRKLTEEEVIELAIDCIGIVAGVETISARVMDALPGLKCISRVGVGMDSVDLEYAKKKGIVVVNTPDGPTRSVAELTLAMTMALLRRVPQADANMKNGIWKKETGNLLFEKTVGVIGLGRIGKTVAQIFRSLGNSVIGYDPIEDTKWAAKYDIKLVPFNDVIKSADILTLHIPGSKDKKPIITKEIIAQMKPKAFLINISRGGVVDETSLEEALRTKQLSGAAVDVFSTEPYHGNLINLDNVVLTPHLGSYAEEGKLKMEIDAVMNLIDAFKRLQPTNYSSFIA
ncbi:MAG: phosphoglycerate dehydrogenase [Ignavibacteria bacterium]|nr:phosphoglycerate dehydrogenase [Ignavibacteria bacterium]